MPVGPAHARSYARIVTFLHLLAVLVGIVATVVAADLLRHANVGTWPIGVVILVLILVTGWTYSAWLAALTLGLATGFAAIAGLDLVRSVARGRRERSESRRTRQEERARQLEKLKPGTHSHRTIL